MKEVQVSSASQHYLAQLNGMVFSGWVGLGLTLPVTQTNKNFMGWVRILQFFCMPNLIINGLIWLIQSEYLKKKKLFCKKNIFLEQ